jgi:hypothetical protein
MHMLLVYVSLTVQPLLLDLYTRMPFPRSLSFIDLDDGFKRTYEIGYEAMPC